MIRETLLSNNYNDNNITEILGDDREGRFVSKLTSELPQCMRLERLNGRGHDNISWQLIPNPDSCREESCG